MFLMMVEQEEPEAEVDDSREIEQVEEALMRGPKVCHLCLLSKPNHRSCVTPFIKQLYPLNKDYKEMDIKSCRLRGFTGVASVCAHARDPCAHTFYVRCCHWLRRSWAAAL